VSPYGKFQQSQRVVEDFSSRTLAAIPSDFGRLYYVSSLRDSSTGRYRHDGLADVFSKDSVQQALEHCHEELFSRILETPLEEQARDLRRCLDAAGNRFWTVVEAWRQDRSYETMCPEGLPGYLSELFCSNLAALLDIFAAETVILDRAS
jgi:hypothetical protein